jgi:hypothetical protein
MTTTISRDVRYIGRSRLQTPVLASLAAWAAATEAVSNSA